MPPVANNHCETDQKGLASNAEDVKRRPAADEWQRSTDEKKCDECLSEAESGVQ